jgi:hypothetical protein
MRCEKTCGVSIWLPVTSVEKDASFLYAYMLRVEDDDRQETAGRVLLEAFRPAG